MNFEDFAAAAKQIDHSIEKRWEGFTRYATADEIAAHKAGGAA